MAEVTNPYFQKKGIGIAIDGKAFLEMQRIRSLYLLSGKNLGDIPTITDFVNGALVYFYIHLKRDYIELPQHPESLEIIPFLKKYFGNVEIEKEFSKEEYNDFVSALPQDIFRAEIFPVQELFIEMKEEIKEEINRKTLLPEPQRISMILTEEMVIWARKINKLINDIYQTRVLYSLSDLVKTIIETIMLTPLEIGYAIEAYFPFLYNMEIKEFIEFNYSTPHLFDHENPDFESSWIKELKAPEYRNLIPILADKPIVDSLIEMTEEFRKEIEAEKLKEVDTLISLNTHKVKRLNRLLDEIDEKMDHKRLWSYVSDFNYKEALIGFGYFCLVLLYDLDVLGAFDLLYKQQGQFVNRLMNLRPDLGHPSGLRALSYKMWLDYLDIFMTRAYIYASLINK